MTHRELYELLQKTKLPVAYDQFEKPQSPPLICFERTGSENISADNIAYAKHNNYRIELYTDKKDTATENIIENLFDENEIFYEVSETSIEKEKIRMVIFTITV